MEVIKRVEKRASRLRMSSEELAGMIDQTLLQPHEGKAAIERLCREAAEYGFRCVCVHPYWLPLCRRLLAGTGVSLVSVVGFPHGLTTAEGKVEETRRAVRMGADEIDMVMNVGAFRDGRLEEVRREIEGTVMAADGRVVKVIIETCFLTYEQTERASRLVKDAGAHFVKTSTGFGPMGATVPHVFLIRRTVGRSTGVKASGGIRNFRDAIRMIAAGASRIGTSSGPAIIDGHRRSADAAWEPEIPCNLCPSGKPETKKMPPDLYDYYSSRCVNCVFRIYRLKC
jgi:deoxyribose-phosphate aldolase